MLVAVEQEPDGRRIVGRVDPVDEPADARGVAAPYGKVEDLLGDLFDPFEEGGPSRQDDAGIERFLITHALDIVIHKPENLLGPRLDDVRQKLAG